MIFALPYIKDLTDYAQLEKELKRKGKLLLHSAVVISTVEDQTEAYDYAQALSELFARTHTVVLTELDRTGNQLSTDFLRAATKFGSEYQTSEGEIKDPALLYMDPGFRPAEAGWLDKIQSNYYLKRAPMVFGKFAKEEPRIAVGPIVFAKGFYNGSGLLPYVPNNIHWRVYMQSELLSNAVETNVIGEVLRKRTSAKP